jgi:hypothetical protein
VARPNPSPRGGAPAPNPGRLPAADDGSAVGYRRESRDGPLELRSGVPVPSAATGGVALGVARSTVRVRPTSGSGCLKSRVAAGRSAASRLRSVEKRSLRVPGRASVLDDGGRRPMLEDRGTARSPSPALRSTLTDRRPKSRGTATGADD